MAQRWQRCFLSQPADVAKQRHRRNMPAGAMLLAPTCDRGHGRRRCEALPVADRHLAHGIGPGQAL